MILESIFDSARQYEELSTDFLRLAFDMFIRPSSLFFCIVQIVDSHRSIRLRPKHSCNLADMAAATIRDSSIGQLIRLVTRKKTLLYPEEEPGFKIPWEEVEAGEMEKEFESDVTTPPASDPEATPRTPVSLQRTITVRTESGLQQVTSRIMSREQTRPWTAERFEVEKSETLDRATSAVIQPQKTADGIILVDWYTTDDPANPQNWTSGKKAWVVFIIWIYTFAVYSGSAIYTSSEPELMHIWNIGQSKASLGLSMYVIGYGLGPMLFSPLSEIPLFGRNVPYVTSLALFTILCVPTALVDNYAGLLVLRFLTGFFGSPCLATGAATMQDLYSFIKLPYALSAWTAAAFCAPALGPLLSGFAVMAKGWRWSLWEILWMAGPVWLFMFLSMPETSSSNILLRRARRLRKLTGNPNLKAQSEIDQGNMKLGKIVFDALVVPIKISFEDPAVGFTNLYTSLIYG